jgi:hypothetical protein
MSPRPKSPGAGAPELWTKGQLARLWVKVRALQIYSPALTVRDICRQLVSAKSMSNPDDLGPDDVPTVVTGYEVWADEKRSDSREQVSRYITNAEQLRRRFGDAEKAIRATDGARERLEQEAHDLARFWRDAPRSRRRGR